MPIETVSLKFVVKAYSCNSQLSRVLPKDRTSFAFAGRMMFIIACNRLAAVLGANLVNSLFQAK